MPKCILLVDDNEIVRAATRHFLERETEFVVCGEAVDGFDALKQAQKLSPDLIVLDLEMPRMNGLQAAVRLREMKVHAPIILFTLYADAISTRDALAADISVVVFKNDTAALRHHVESLLATHHNNF